jgi:hypothetical protein
MAAWEPPCSLRECEKGFGDSTPEAKEMSMSLESWNDTPTKQAILDFVATASADGGCVDHRRRGVWHDGRARDAEAISRVAGGFFPKGLKR